MYVAMEEEEDGAEGAKEENSAMDTTVSSSALALATTEEAMADLSLAHTVTTAAGNETVVDSIPGEEQAPAPTVAKYFQHRRAPCPRINPCLLMRYRQ